MLAVAAGVCVATASPQRPTAEYSWPGADAASTDSAEAPDRCGSDGGWVRLGPHIAELLASAAILSWASIAGLP